MGKNHEKCLKCALKRDLMFILSKDLDSLGPKTPINMYNMPILRLEVVLHIFMPEFPTVQHWKKLIRRIGMHKSGQMLKKMLNYVLGK